MEEIRRTQFSLSGKFNSRTDNWPGWCSQTAKTNVQFNFHSSKICIAYLIQNIAENY